MQPQKTAHHQPRADNQHDRERDFRDDQCVARAAPGRSLLSTLLEHGSEPRPGVLQRGYKTSEVDWVLDRLGQELDLLRGQLAAVQAIQTGTDEGPEENQFEGGTHALPSEDRADS